MDTPLMKTSLITSKTHFYINVRYYASEYYLKHFHNSESSIYEKANKAHWEAAEKYTKFKTTFFEKWCEQKHNDFIIKFSIGLSSEAFVEEVREKTGVKICCAEGNYTYCIPKVREDIFNWMQKELTHQQITHKVLKKTRGTYTDVGISRYFRVVAFHNARKFQAKLEKREMLNSEKRRIFVYKPTTELSDLVRTFEFRNVSCGILNISDDFPVEGIEITIDDLTIDYTDSFFRDQIQIVESKDAISLLQHYSKEITKHKNDIIDKEIAKLEKQKHE